MEPYAEGLSKYKAAFNVIKIKNLGFYHFLIYIYTYISNIVCLIFSNYIFYNKFSSIKKFD